MSNTSDAIFDQDPNAGSAASGDLLPIGVPADYFATRRYAVDPRYKAGQVGPPAPGAAQGPPAPGSYEVAPQYHQGDEWNPASSGAPKIAELQDKLAAAGLLKGEYRRGVYDAGTRAAYTLLLAEANGSGYTDEQQLTIRINAPKTADPKAAFVPAPYLKADPATLRGKIRDLGKSTLGRDLNDEEVARMEGTFANLDRQAYDANTAAQQADFNANTAAADGATGVGGATVQAVDPAAQFQEYLTNRYRPEIDMTKGVADLGTNRGGLMGSIFTFDKAIGA